MPGRKKGKLTRWRAFKSVGGSLVSGFLWKGRIGGSQGAWTPVFRGGREKDEYKRTLRRTYEARAWSIAIPLTGGLAIIPFLLAKTEMKFRGTRKRERRAARDQEGRLLLQRLVTDHFQDIKNEYNFPEDTDEEELLWAIKFYLQKRDSLDRSIYKRKSHEFQLAVSKFFADWVKDNPVFGVMIKKYKHDGKQARGEALVFLLFEECADILCEAYDLESEEELHIVRRFISGLLNFKIFLGTTIWEELEPRVKNSCKRMLQDWHKKNPIFGEVIKTYKFKIKEVAEAYQD